MNSEIEMLKRILECTVHINCSLKASDFESAEKSIEYRKVLVEEFLNLDRFEDSNIIEEIIKEIDELDKLSQVYLKDMMNELSSNLVDNNKKKRDVTHKAKASKSYGAKDFNYGIGRILDNKK